MRPFAGRVVMAVVGLVPAILTPTTPKPAPHVPVPGFVLQTPLPHVAPVPPEFVHIPTLIPPPPAQRPALVVELPTSMSVMSQPGGGSYVGTIPAYSKFGSRMVAWVEELSKSGKYGKVTVPYTMSPRTGWIRLSGLEKVRSKYVVKADISKHVLSLYKLGRRVMHVPAAMGSPATPTPPGKYYVADRWASNPYGSLGAFVFALSGLQRNYPGASSGLFIMAIHGTNNPATLGQSVSGGCLRLSAKAIHKLIPILRLGTPVIIRP
jgi:lipoprotein-anchoring transpeptidase ErfK/SrfK